MTPTGALIATTYAVVVRADAGDVGRARRLRRRRSRRSGDAERAARAARSAATTPARAECRPSADRVTVIECEIDDMNPQIFGVGDGSALCRRRARGVLRPGADEEEPAGHAADGRGAARRCARRWPTSSSARRRRSACATTRSSASACEREIVTVETPIGAVRFKLAWRDGRVDQRRARVRRLRAARAAHNLSGQGSAGASPLSGIPQPRPS